MRRSKLWYFWWGCWLAGAAIVLASWFNVVTATVGWVGFALGMVGYLGSRLPFLNRADADQGPPQETSDPPPDPPEGQHNWGAGEDRQ